MTTPSPAADQLRPYLPRLAIRWLADSPDRLEHDVDGTMLFADVSGFTRLSERLAKRGRIGAEELTDTISTCFARLLGVAYGNGGSLLKFGGDALLLLFTGNEHAAKACRAAAGMRRELRAMGSIATSSGPVRLRVAIGVHTGRFHLFAVGRSHRELVVTGPAASETVRMEAAAGSGQIVVSPDTAAALPERCLGAPLGPGRLLVREPPGLARDPVPHPEVADTDALLSGLPLGLREHLASGVDVPEHRSVAVGFLRFSGTDHLLATSGPAAVAAELDRLVGDVQDAIARHGGCFLGSDVDDDGGKLLLVAGAPTSAGSDEDRMLLVLRDVVAARRTLKVRAGVNVGHVFTGAIGPPYRRTYTVMGDAVNLAARVMARAADGTVLATDGTLGRCELAFETSAVEPFMVKGKAHPVAAAVVGAARGRRVPGGAVQAPLVGREVELAWLQAAWTRCVEGQGQLVEVVGEAGIGKSRLVDELVAMGDRSVSVACEQYAVSSAYHPVRALLRAALGVTSDDEAATVARLELVLRERAPELAVWAPLLGVVLGVKLPPTPDVLALDEEFRRLRLERVTVDLLVALLDRPVVVRVEDAHWMDEASSQLFASLAARLDEVPWLICVTRRDVAQGYVPDPSQASSLRPAPLGIAAAGALAEAVADGSQLAPHEVTALVERSGGNPLFLAELVSGARASGGLDRLPDSVEGVITARIDRLPPRERSLLRRLSVLGAAFSADLAREALGEHLRDPAEAWRRLADFVSVEGDGQVRFRHALIRDGAYEGLPYRLRESLHAVVGDAIARGAAGPASPDHAALLSLHYFHARRYAEAWENAMLAADRARSLYANAEALALYDRAIQCGRRGGCAEAGELARAYEALGDVRRRCGQLEAAGAAFRAAARLARTDVVATARLMQKQAQARQGGGQYAQAIRLLCRARRVLREESGDAAARQRAQLSVARASVHKDQGLAGSLIRWCDRALAEAELAGDKDALAHAYFLLDHGYVALGKSERAVHSQRALALYQDLGDLWGEGAVLNNLGARAYWAGRWGEAVHLYEQAKRAWERIGDVVNAAYGNANIGEIRSDQGRYLEAEQLYRHAEKVWRVAGDRGGVGYVRSNLGRLYVRSGDHVRGMTLLAEARGLLAELGQVADTVDADLRIAEGLLRRDDAREARSVLRATGEQAGLTGLQRAFRHRLEGYAALRENHLPAAEAAFETSLVSARAEGATYDEALGTLGLARVREARGTDAASLRSMAHAVLGALGVEQVSEPVGGATGMVLLQDLPRQAGPSGVREVIPTT